MQSRRLKWSYSDELSGPRSRSPRRLRQEDVDVVFQPIVELATGDVFAHEALTRCNLEVFASPLELFDAAARERCCGRLGRLIREVAFSRAPATPLFVNVHPSELAERWLVRPDDPIGFHEPGVFLEITESAAFDNQELAVRVLRDVCSRVGAQLVVDDLGAGHSDIFRVLDLEPDVVKLDRELVTGLDKDPAQQKRVTYFVELCTELGALVIAEGVETQEELRALQDTGAPFAQGYLLAKPAFPTPPINWSSEWGSHERPRGKSLRPRAR